MSTEVFGDFIQQLPQSAEYLTIGFSPTSLPLKHRWENNGLSADFIADYFRNFYISKREAAGEAADATEVDNLRDAVKYIANELLENAMKFQSEEIPSTATIGFSLYSERLVFSITNGVNKVQAEKFKKHVQSIVSEDPMELYIQAMRDSANAENANRSGLGLLSMICDYSARLGWEFKSHPDNAELQMVTTMVSLDA